MVTPRKLAEKVEAGKQPKKLMFKIYAGMNYAENERNEEWDATDPQDLADLLKQMVIQEEDATSFVVTITRVQPEGE